MASDSRRRRRRRRRLIVLLVILLIILALTSVMYVNYRATRNLGFDFGGGDETLVRVPDYLFSFTGPEEQRMVNPVGVYVSGDRVLVADSRRAIVDIYDLDGERTGQFEKEALLRPLYIAQNPLTDEFYVSDRRLRTVEIFSSDGAHVGTFEPNLPPEELPDFETQGIPWVPIALTFDEEGSLYVLEYLKGHRMLKFDADGEFVWSEGDLGFAQSASEDPEFFQFPNSIKVNGDDIWVSDSNNRRVQVFSKDTGEYQRLLPMAGLPRGFELILPAEEQSSGDPTHIVMVDTLAHDATIWDLQGNKVVTFGEIGVLEGQFSYPNDVSVAENAYMYISDSANGRVQVWGWPAPPVPIPTPQKPWQWALCFSPLLLLPLLLFFRRRKFFATQEWLELFIAEEQLYLLPDRRRKWIVEPEVYEEFEDVEEGDVRLGDLLEPFEHSESDADSIEERFETDHITAIRLAIAQRAWVFCTEDFELRRFAKVMDLDVVNRNEFLDRFTDEDPDDEETGTTSLLD